MILSLVISQLRFYWSRPSNIQVHCPITVLAAIIEHRPPRISQQLTTTPTRPAKSKPDQNVGRADVADKTARVIYYYLPLECHRIGL